MIRPLVGVGVGGADRLTLMEPEVPTQYAWFFQKLVLQSVETAGFQAKNCDMVMKYLSATLAQLSPSTTVCHLTQSMIKS